MVPLKDWLGRWVDRAELTGGMARSIVVMKFLNLQKLGYTHSLVLSRYFEWHTEKLAIPKKPTGAHLSVSEEDERAPQVFQAMRRTGKIKSEPRFPTLQPAKETSRTICSSVRPVFAFTDTQNLRERNRPFSKLVLRSNRSQPGRKALNQIISEGGHLPSPDPLDTNSSRALQHCRLDSPIGIFTSEMSESVC
jgi:hypothetical protein